MKCLSRFTVASFSATAAVAALCAVCAPTAKAQNFTQVSCGQVISESIDVANDLEGCPGDGLVVGADGITVDLRGHSITGRLGADGCEGDCIGRYGIDTAGHDGLAIKNGTLGYFRRAVYMRDTNNSRLANLETGQGPYAVERIGILLLRSSGNLLSSVTDRGGDPGILLWQSSRNTIEDSSTDGYLSMRRGNGLMLAADSDYNRVVRTTIRGNWTGLQIVTATHNKVVGSLAQGYVENVLAGDDNVIVDSHLGYNKWAGLRIAGNRNTLKRNTIEGGDGIDLDGNRNVISRNEFPDTGYQAAILVGSGRRNQVAGNRIAVAPDQYTGNYGIHILPAAFSTELTGNQVAHANRDGIFIEAAGTIVGNNTANDNRYIGINAVHGVIDAGGNRARGNGNPFQCINVFCQ